jgi:hypothetical protein
MPEIELAGIDGGNLLAFLAAVGTLRVASLADRTASVRMRWVERGRWTPVMGHAGCASNEDLMDLLTRRVCGEETVDEAWKIGDDLRFALDEFAAILREAASQASPDCRATADFLSSFGSEAFGTGPKKEQISDSEFRTMSGAGHQHFLGFMRKLAAGCETGHLRRALFEEWDYGDDGPSLRWDAADFRPHALRAEDPSTDPIKTMRGANRLAIEALPLFPTAPGLRRLRTIGFGERDGDAAVAWPIWRDALDLETVASLMASARLWDGGRDELASMGICQVYEARRSPRESTGILVQPQRGSRLYMSNTPSFHRCYGSFLVSANVARRLFEAGQVASSWEGGLS